MLDPVVTDFEPSMRHGWITTLRRDGSPRTSRVWFVENAGDVWIASAETNRKVADIRRDSRSTFAIEGCHGARTMTASIEPIETRSEIVTAFARNYHGWDAADSAVDGQRILIRLTSGEPGKS